MKKALALSLLLALTAGCASAPLKTLPPETAAAASPSTAPAAPGGAAPAAADAATAPAAKVASAGSSPEAAVSAPQDKPSEAAGSAAEADGPAPDAASQLPTTTVTLAAMVRVALPAPESLDATDQDADRRNQSPWEVAQAAIYRLYMDRADLASALAPGLAERIGPLTETVPAHLWMTHAGSWEEDGRFYFHLQITGRTADGEIARVGVDVLEVSSLPGYGCLVTGFAHAPWASQQADSPVKVWTGSSPDGYLAPREVALPAPPLEESGRILIPLAAAGAIGSPREVGAGRYVVDLTAGETSGEVPTVVRNGLPYALVDDLAAAINGQAGPLPDATGSYSYQAEWQPGLRQLLLWADIQHRIS